MAITGARTFLGRGIIPHLQKEGVRVVAIDVERPPSLPPKVPFYRVDLTLPTADTILAEIFRNENVTEVIHLAFPGRPRRDLEVAHEFTVIGTWHLLHAVQASGVERVIARSSTLVYGANPENPHYLPESSPPRGVLRYAWVNDQIEAENLLREHGEKTGTQVTLLRFAPVLGPTVNNLFTRIFSTPVVWTVLGYDPLWQLLHESDALSALVLAYRHSPGGIFNIVAPGALPLSTLIYLAGRINLPMPKWALKEIVRAGWIVGTCPYPPEQL